MSDIPTNPPTNCGYKPGQIANYMLEKADLEGLAITPMKLQKLVYNGYGWVRAILDRRLFDESIEAWDHGPVIPSLYHEFKNFGWTPIKGKCVQFLPFSPGHEYPEPLPSPTDKEERAVLNMVWKVYKDFTATHLRAQTHMKDTPWYEVYHSDGGDTATHNRVISDEEIKIYFERNIRGYLKKFC